MINTTPSAVRLGTRSMPSHGGGICAAQPRLPLARNTISFVLAQLSRKLFLSAQSVTCESSKSSVTHISQFSAAAITYVSSANLTTFCRCAQVSGLLQLPGMSPVLGRILYYTGLNVCTCRYFFGILRAVRTIVKEVFYPVVSLVRQLQLCHLINQCGMPNGVERL